MAAADQQACGCIAVSAAVTAAAAAVAAAAAHLRHRGRQARLQQPAGRLRLLLAVQRS